MAPSVIKTLYKTVQKWSGLSEKQMLTPYYWLPYHLYKDGRAWRPLFVTLEVTYLCNLRCQMCSLVEGEMVTKAGQRKNPELADAEGNLRREVSTEEYLRLIDQMADAGVKSVQITGGEPLFKRDILQIVESIKKKGMHLSIISNGSAKPETYRELVRLGLDSITISVDGTRDVHDHVRGLDGSFDKTQLAIRTLAEAKKELERSRPKVTVSCAVSALNQHDLENLVEHLEHASIDDLNFGYLHFSTPDRDAQTENKLGGDVMHLKKPHLKDPVLDVDTADLAQRVARIKDRRNGRPFPVVFNPDLNADEIKLQYTDEMFTFANKCFYAWYATRIDPWGQMYPCWIDIRLGDVREKGFLELWNGQGYREFRRLIRKEKLVPKCTTCCVLTDKYWSRLPTFRS